MALDLIYDRTDEDAERWLYLSEKMDAEGFEALTPEEQTEWLTDIKGGYNFSDLNRVGAAVSYLAGRYRNLLTHMAEYVDDHGVADDPLFHLPYTASDVTVSAKTNWALGDYMRPNQAAQFLLNLTVLRGLMTVPDGTPPVPADMIDLTIGEANDIERLLDMLDDEITRVTATMEKWVRDTAAAWFFSNDPYSSEVNA